MFEKLRARRLGRIQKVVHSLYEKRLLLRNAVGPGGRHLSDLATGTCYRLGRDRAIQATSDRATREIRRPARAFPVVGDRGFARNGFTGGPLH